MQTDHRIAARRRGKDPLVATTKGTPYDPLGHEGIDQQSSCSGQFH